MSLSCLIIPKQFPHFQLNLTELVLLALVLLFNGAGIVIIRDQHQTAVHNLNGECAANIKPSLLKPLAFQVDRGRGFGLSFCGTYPTV
ncbi:hypothetical protein [Xenorhabdus griffiniae]|uniref:hypothetical protein n=1 Tax=Xenorhabdus griffiniae TaxID=351672 RepID=UPI003BAF5FE4